MIREILLTNYKIFSGVTCLSVATPPLSPITVVSSATNSGKTTVLDAIHWCLFGEGLFDNDIQQNDYERLNHDVLDELPEGISAIVAVSLSFDIGDSILKIRREQRIKKDFPTPKVISRKVFINDSEVSDTEYRDKVNSLVDPHIAATFFVTSEVVEQRGTKRIASKINEFVSHRCEMLERFTALKKGNSPLISTGQNATYDTSKDILLRQEAISSFFNSIVPTALNSNIALGHTLVVCPNSKHLDAFVKVLGSEVLQRKVERLPNEGKMRMGDVWAAFSNLNELDICVQDISVLPTDADSKKHIQSALTEFYSNLQIGAGPGARQVRLDLPPFTFVALANTMSEVPKSFLPLFENIIEIKPGEPITTEDYSNILYKRILADANDYLRAMRFDECSVGFRDSTFVLNSNANEKQETWGVSTDSLTLNLSLVLSYQKQLSDGENKDVSLPMILDDFWHPCIDFSKLNFKGLINLLSQNQLLMMVLEGNNEEQLLDENIEIGLRHRIFRGEYIEE